MRFNTFGDCAREESSRISPVSYCIVAARSAGGPGRRCAVRSSAFPSCRPILPSCANDCYEAYNIQVQGLATRLQASKIERAVIGVSGGLDSTQALIVAARAMDRLELSAQQRARLHDAGLRDIRPDQAQRLGADERLGVTGGEIDIRPAARQMLADLGHPFASGEPVYDVTFENVQAGLRTDYLFRLANQKRGMVVGTGDLSELGLGWCTYGVGDHMSHYNVNGSVLEDADPAPDPLRGGLRRRRAMRRRTFCATCWTPKSRPSWFRPVRVEGCSRREQIDRSLCTAGLQSVLPHAIWLQTVEDRLPGASRVGRCRARAPGRSTSRLRTGAPTRLAGNSPLVGAVSAAILRQPVQALGFAERSEDVVRWLALPAGRLASPSGCGRGCVACGAGRERARDVTAGVHIAGRVAGKGAIDDSVRNPDERGRSSEGWRGPSLSTVRAASNGRLRHGSRASARVQGGRA